MTICHSFDIILKLSNWRQAFDSLAQLAEHLTFNQGVRGSNPRWITRKNLILWNEVFSINIVFKSSLLTIDSKIDKVRQSFVDFYKFLIELSDKELENELKTYRAYYVPAVAEKYISNMPVWDGNFNWNHWKLIYIGV